MNNLNALTDTTLTIMSYNVQMLPVPLSNQLNLSTRQDALIEYICTLDDLLNIDILVLNEVFTRDFYDLLTKGKVKDKFPYHTNVIGRKDEGTVKWSKSIAQVEKDARVGSSTKGKTPKKKAAEGKVPNDLNRKVVSTKAAPPKGPPSKVTTLGGAIPRGQKTSSLNSSDTNNNNEEEAGETLNLDSSDASNRSDSECILSFHCGVERGNKIKGKSSSHNYKVVENSNERSNERFNGGDESTKTESSNSDKEAQCSETDDGMVFPGERQNLWVNSRGSTKKGAPGRTPHANVDELTKESSSRRNTADLENNNGDSKLSTQSSYRTDGKLSIQSSNNAGEDHINAICDITSEDKTSTYNRVNSAENLKEKKSEGKKNKKKNQQNISSFDSVSGKSKFYHFLNGGVIVLSKHPFLHKHAMLYSNSKFPDMFCTKGAIYIKLSVNNKPVNVIATHLQAGDSSGEQNCRWKQLNELSNWVYNGTPSLHIKKNEPLFFVGDFNIRYEVDKSFFDKVLSSDCLNSYVTKKALETTFDSYLNDYCMHMERDYSFKYKYTLDYILVNKDCNVKTLVPQTAIQKGYRPIQIIKCLFGFIPYKCTYVHHPSDHFPIYATFKIPN
ncbi:Sphingomyelin phosphodiesterase [Plasmodium coatneyi]|uniref:Sphingomyelin phosphodiesterase n=1 Tax=Plasmodium coatneyi TaxID=208452 RepID=A0A1B1E7Q7_9APIC|nr:Sphingomyelin phosphodiesterase [Plasmodium coatneyi]ANQ11056.1 Sphingomyelin phosphodiesterase [Plasmodium coatneyi]